MNRAIKQKINNWKTKKALKAYFEPGKEFLDKSRQAFLSEIGEKYGIAPAPIFNYGLMAKYGAAIFAVAVLSTSGLVAFAEQRNVSPEHPLYKFKIIAEDVQLELAPAENKHVLYERFAQRRLAEIETIMESEPEMKVGKEIKTEIKEDFRQIENQTLSAPFAPAAVQQPKDSEKEVKKIEKGSTDIKKEEEIKKKWDKINEIRQNLQGRMENLESEIQEQKINTQNLSNICNLETKILNKESKEKSEKLLKFEKRCEEIKNRSENSNEEVKGVEIKKQDKSGENEVELKEKRKTEEIRKEEIKKEENKSGSSDRNSDNKDSNNSDSDND